MLSPIPQDLELVLNLSATIFPPSKSQVSSVLPTKDSTHSQLHLKLTLFQVIFLIIVVITSVVPID